MWRGRGRNLGILWRAKSGESTKWGFLHKSPQKSPREYSANRKPYIISNVIKRDNSTRRSDVVSKLNFAYRTSVAKGDWHNPYILVDCQHFQRSYADASFNFGLQVASFSSWEHFFFELSGLFHFEVVSFSNCLQVASVASLSIICIML